MASESAGGKHLKCITRTSRMTRPRPCLMNRWCTSSASPLVHRPICRHLHLWSSSRLKLMCLESGVRPRYSKTKKGACDDPTCVTFVLSCDVSHLFVCKKIYVSVYLFLRWRLLVYIYIYIYVRCVYIYIYLLGTSYVVTRTPCG